MSNETVVNRTPETIGQKIERERLEAETEMTSEGAPAEIDSSIHILPIPPIPSEAWQFISEAQAASQPGYADHISGASDAEQRIDREFLVQGEPGTSGEAQAKVAEIEARIEKLKEPILPSELEQRVREILGVRAHAPRDPDLREFKEQVIRAFKHIGLDTPKFFS